MPIKSYRPTTPGRRHSSVLDTSMLSKVRPRKGLRVTRKGHAGRNNQGKITVRHRGGTGRRFVRIVDWQLNTFDIPARVESLEYDPNRSAHIALAVYRNGARQYIVAQEGLGVGSTIIASRSKAPIEVGNRMPLEFIPVGIDVSNVELRAGEGGKIARGAGTGVKLVAIEGNHAQLRLPSSEVRQVSKHCMASIGVVGNADWRNVRWGLAGRMRRKGWRPTVRGKAMNPVDHPHGGGEGRQPIGLKHPKTPWGKPALGVQTRRAKKSSSRMIMSRRRNRRLRNKQ